MLTREVDHFAHAATVFKYRLSYHKHFWYVKWSGMCETRRVYFSRGHEYKIIIFINL